MIDRRDCKSRAGWIGRWLGGRSESHSVRVSECARNPLDQRLEGRLAAYSMSLLMFLQRHSPYQLGDEQGKLRLVRRCQ